MDGEVEGVGDLDESGEADPGVVAGFVALDRLFLEAGPFGELALREATSDPGAERRRGSG